MAALEFWGVEVKPGKKIICQPGDEKFIHLSQAALGEVKDKSAKSVQLTVNFEGSKFVIGTLSSKSCTQIAYDVVFQKNFELSHNWNDGSVFFIGYKTQFEDGGSEDDSGNLITETEKHAALVNKKVKTSKINAKPAEPNKDGSDSNDDVSEDGSDDDASEEGSDNDDAPEEGSDDDDANEVVSSDDAGDNDSSDEEKSYSFKAETSKKRTADSDSDSESKVPKKKVKLATPPGKTELIMDPKVRADAMKLLMTKPKDWIRAELMKSLNSAYYLAHAYIGHTLDDSLKAQERYNQLDTKYTESQKQLHKLRNVKANLVNYQENVIPKKDKIIDSQKKELDEYVQKIMALRKELEDSRATSKKEVEDLKIQLEAEAEIGSVVSCEATNRELKTNLFQSETKCEKLNGQLFRSGEELEKVKKELFVLSEKVKDLEFEKNDQSDQLQELNFFGPSVFPALPVDFVCDILTWVEEHPEELLKNKDALDKLKNEAKED